MKTARKENVIRMSALRQFAAMVMVLSVVLISASCGGGQREKSENEEETTTTPAGVRTAIAAMEPASGSNVSGEANFSEEGNSIRFTLSVQNLTPGEHAVHLHEMGDCSAGDASSAGGHWNPTMKPHGKREQGSHSYHKGDIANMTVGQDGTGKLDLAIEGWSIGGADTTNILGKSVIIHEKADDFTSQPSGNAGSRVSCGVVRNN